MTTTAPTRQLLDPAGILAAYPTAYWLTALAFVTGAIPTVGSLTTGGGVPLLVIAAMVIFTGCCAVVIISANPHRAPFTKFAHLLVHSLAVAAFVVSSLATWDQGPSFVRGSWVAMGLGVLIIAVSPYRPVKEQAAAGSISALLVALMAFVKAESSGAEAPPLALAVGSAIAILALCYGNAAYSGATIRSLDRSMRRADAASDALSTDVSEGIVRLVRADRATILERDVRPFFAELVADPELTAEQKERAREISDAIRQAMVADADRTWLGTLFARSNSPVLHRASIDDPSTVASAMGPMQRTALRALVVAAGGDRSVAEVTVSISVHGRTCTGILTLDIDSSENRVRETYGPFFAVMRVAFSSFSLHFDHSSLTVRFSYDRH